MSAALLVAAFALAQAASDAPASPVPTPSAEPIPAGAAVIRNSGSSNTLGYDVVVSRDGDVSILAARERTHATLAAPQTRWLFYKLAQAPALDTLAGTPCMKSASFGTTTTLAWNGRVSPDLSCPGGDATLREFARIADVIVAKLGVRTRPTPRRMPL